MLDNIFEDLGFDSTNALDIGEGNLFYGLVKAMKPKVIVETGTHRGASAIFFAQGLKENGFGHIYTCDPYNYDPEDNFKKAGVAEFVTYTQTEGIKQEVPDEIDMLFIDGYHDYSSVVSEYNYYKPKLSDKAVIIFHDCGEDNGLCEVNRAVKNLGIDNILLKTHGHIRIGVIDNNYEL